MHTCVWIGLPRRSRREYERKYWVRRYADPGSCLLMYANNREHDHDKILVGLLVSWCLLLVSGVCYSRPCPRPHTPLLYSTLPYTSRHYARTLVNAGCRGAPTLSPVHHSDSREVVDSQWVKGVLSWWIRCVVRDAVLFRALSRLGFVQFVQGRGGMWWNADVPRRPEMSGRGRY